MRFLILILFSCASLVDRGPLKKENIKEILSGACLTGEGEGRIKIGNDQFAFGYGSQFENQTWMLSVDVPFRGEEDFLVKKSGKAYLFSGSFFRQMTAGYQDLTNKNKTYRKEYLTNFLQFMGNNLFWLKEFHTKNQSWFESYFLKRCGPAPVKNCSFKSRGRSVELTTNSLKITKKLDKFTLEWVFKDFSNELDGFFKSSDLHLLRGRQSVMGVRFKHESCQNAPATL